MTAHYRRALAQAARGSRSTRPTSRPTTLRWTIALLILTLPLGPRVSIGPVDLVQVVAAVCVVLVVLQRTARGRPPLWWHPVGSWAVLLVALVLVSATTAVDQDVALRQAAALAVAMTLALAVNSACQTLPHVRQLMVALALVGGVICLESLRHVGSLQVQDAGAGAVTGRASGMFNQPNELGAFSCVVLFVGIGLALGAVHRWERTLGTGCALAASAALAMSLSRGAWLGTALALVVLLWLSPRSRRRLAVAMLALLGVGVPVLLLTASGVADILRARAGTLLQASSANPQDARPLIYREALRQIAERPWLGHGPGNFLPSSQSVGSASPGVAAEHAHNVLLNVAAEIGLPAAGVLVLLTLSTAAGVLRARARLHPRDGDLVVSLGCSLVALVGHGLVDYTYRNPTLLFVAWLVLGLVLSAISDRATAQEATGPAAPAGALPQPAPHGHGDGLRDLLDRRGAVEPGDAELLR